MEKRRNSQQELSPERNRKEPSAPRLKPYRIAAIAAGVALLIVFVVGRKKEDAEEQRKKPTPAQLDPGYEPQKSSKRTTGTPALPKPAFPPLPRSAREATNLQEACDSLTGIREGEESSIYERFWKIVEFMEADPEKRIFAVAELDRIAKACGIEREEILRILKGALERGDTRVASILQAYLEHLCLEEEKREAREPIFPNLAACKDLSPENPRQACESRIRKKGIQTCVGNTPLNEITDEMERCYDAFYRRIQRECPRLPEGESPMQLCFREQEEKAKREEARQREEEGACPGRKAQELGIDIYTVRTLDAQGKTNSLVAIKLAFSNTDEPPSEEDLFEYGEIMREILFYAQNAEFLRALGVQNLQELKQKYVDEAARALRELGRTLGGESGKRYLNFANFLETVWMAHRLLNE